MLVFQGHPSNFKVTRAPQNTVLACILGVSQFEITNVNESLHEASKHWGEGPYKFSRSYVKFQGHMGPAKCRFCPGLSVFAL